MLDALCVTPSPCYSYIETAVWDGSQLLYETRAPTSSSNTFTSGTVGYLHAGDLDQPLAVIHNDSTVVVTYDWRGLAVSSVTVTGAGADCIVTSCTNSAVWAGQSQAGVYFDPGPFGGTPSGVPTWMGTLTANGGSGGGVLYRRNRYYDPTSGQFTQEDPSGLGGGLNLYGFAAGDPVNGTDPFGLCTDSNGKQVPDAQCTDTVSVTAMKGLNHSPGGHIGVSVDGDPAVGLEPGLGWFGFLWGTGSIDAVDPSRNVVQSVSIPITAAQANLMRNYIRGAGKSPPDYNFFASNCATFAERVLRSAGLYAPHDGMPGTLLMDLQAHVAFWDRWPTVGPATQH